MAIFFLDIGCKGDPNAVSNPCPSSCPATCALPDNSLILCVDECDSSGCECKPGYVLSEPGGKCIRPEECPGLLFFMLTKIFE